ncbi:armadillo repeat-containing protein 1 [Salmo salar]|uniref:Armadillo repeat-containing protein 1 n=1 Tax=Salmo salar TaxID=8030 RepID=A0ABM3CU13_SALSA|nr:armadillo repeat-containing protein 1 [Salmo salar]
MSCKRQPPQERLSCWPQKSMNSSRLLMSRRSLCEESLLKIRGVISFTFQMGVKRCIVRIRSDLKAEVIIPFPEDGSVAVEQNVDLPEEESPSQEPDKAVTCVGTGQDGAGWLGTAANFLSRPFYW